jgi:V/A-type H+/Na+-transporting ATPase subunit C
MGNYEYANARIRALKGQLFDRAAYAELAALTRLDDLIAHLAQSPYAAAIDTALGRYNGLRAVMEGCRLHQAYSYHQLRSFFDDQGSRLVGLLLARWDLFNLKTLLRGQRADVAPDQILESLVPAGDLDERALRALVHEPDTRATVDLLWAWNSAYGRSARVALDKYTATNDWSVFETTFDGLFYVAILDGLGGSKNEQLVREFLAREIDATNILSALRLRQALAVATPVLAQRFLGGGTISRAWLVRLAREPRDDTARNTLRAAPLAGAFIGIERLDIGGAQRALERHLLRFGLEFFTRDPLTVAPAIGYLTAKRVEAGNIRLIAQGLAVGASRAEIEHELMV